MHTLGMTRDLQNLAASAKGGDSESELQDQTPDTDDSGAHSYPEVSGSAFVVPGSGSFKRAPIMGNRGLEQRGRKTKTYPDKEQKQAQPQVCIVYRILFYLNAYALCTCRFRSLPWKCKMCAKLLVATVRYRKERESAPTLNLSARAVFLARSKQLNPPPPVFLLPAPRRLRQLRMRRRRHNVRFPHVRISVLNPR